MYIARDECAIAPQYGATDKIPFIKTSIRRQLLISITTPTTPDDQRYRPKPAMAYVDVTGAWSADHVVLWLKGLHPSLETAPMNQIIRQRINGNRLMLISALDFIELIPNIRVEALHAITHGIDLLRDLNHNSKSETLQSLTLNLACQARYLYNQIIQAEHSPRLLPVSTTATTPMTGNSKNRFDFAKVDSNMQINQSTKQRVSLETLESVSIIVDQILHVVEWLKSAELSSNLSKFNKDFKSIVLRVAVELTSTAQRDRFVEQPNDILKKTSKFLAEYCEWVVLAIDDPDFIQPCWLDVVSVKKKPDEDDFGIILNPTTIDSLAIDEVVFSSPAHRSGRICKGDEIVQVDYQTVVGWPQEKVRDYIKKYSSEIILTIKKKPVQLTLNPSIVVMKPYAIPVKRVLSYTIPEPQSKNSNRNDELSIDGHGILERQSSFVVEQLDDAEGENQALEPPKEPKGPVYPKLQATKPRHELRRRMSISGDISDWWFEPRVLADSLPIPSLEKSILQGTESSAPQDKTRLGGMTKEAITKSFSHDTAKLYLHLRSLDKG